MRQTNVKSGITPLFDRIKAVLRYAPNRSLRLADILSILRQIVCLLTCRGEIVSETTNVSGRVVIRNPEPMAKKTVILNQGGGNIILFEDGKVIAILDGDSTYTLPTEGRLTIEAEGSSTVTVTTYRRCACNAEQEYESPDEPIGGHLL